ncbi:MAG: hypothetical protein GF401_21070, partial [Chitinivibrionales bacterium]|nr:hypothetical protein [Chitinivibrionales bacterium]
RRLLSKTFPSGMEISNVYDKTRLMRKRTPEGNIDFKYLCGDKVGSITKGIESVSYGYDGGLITSVTQAGTINQTLSYDYNNDFNVEGFTYAGSTVNYTYDNDGLLTGSGNYTITRNPDNGLPENVSDGVFNHTGTFNGYGEVDEQACSVNSQPVGSLSVTRDNTGGIVTKSETFDGVTSNYAYTYDPMGRLLTVTKDGVLVEEYRYDPNGTRNYEMNARRGITGRTLTYSLEDHLMTAGTVTYQYDLDGFLVSKMDGADVTTYNYSSRGELLSVSLPDGATIEYRHDPLGRRIAKLMNGTVMEKYLWQGMTRLLAIYDGSDNLLMRFDYADGRMPVSLTKDGMIYYMSYDQVGSLKTVSDASGAVVKSIEYDSFGNILADTNPAFEVPFGFAGGLHDRDTGLVRFGYRDYDPDVGRWAGKDPIGFYGGDTDFYGYCFNVTIHSPL